MEERIEPKSERKEKLSKTQLLIAKNSPKIIDYLEEVVKGQQSKDPNRHIGYSFKVDSNLGRPFFEELGIDTKQIDSTLGDKSVISKYEDRFKKIHTGISEEDREKITNNIEYFFRPIEESKEWRSFWENQKKLIANDLLAKNPAATGEEIEKEQNKIRNQIASAVTYKIQSMYSKKNPLILRNEKDKVMAVTKTINMLGEQRESTRELKTEQIEKESSKLKVDVERLLEPILFRQIKPGDVYENIKKGLKDIRNLPYFSTLTNGEELLQKYLLETFNKLQFLEYSDKYSKNTFFFSHKEELLKELAKGILADIHTNHFKEFKKTDARPPKYLLETLHELTPFVGAKSKGEQHKKPFELVTAYLTNWAPLMMARKGSVVVHENPLLKNIKPPKEKKERQEAPDVMITAKTDPIISVPEKRQRSMTRSHSFTHGIGQQDQKKQEDKKEEPKKRGSLEKKT